MSIGKDLKELGAAHQRFKAATAEDIEGKIVRRVAKLEKDSAAMRDLLEHLWARWDKSDTQAAPTLALDIALVLGYRECARTIAKEHQYTIALADHNRIPQIAKLLNGGK